MQAERQRRMSTALRRQHTVIVNWCTVSVRAPFPVSVEKARALAVQVYLGRPTWAVTHITPPHRTPALQMP